MLAIYVTNIRALGRTVSGEGGGEHGAHQCLQCTE
jgi:hypothetical protein